MNTRFTVVLLTGLAMNICALAEFPNYTGTVVPRPQEMSSKWHTCLADANSITIAVDPNAHNAIKLARTMIIERIAEIQKQAHQKKAGKPVNMYLGILNSNLIKGLSSKYDLHFDTLALPSQGYAIRVIDTAQSTEIIGAGVNHRGTFYAATTILQQIGVEQGAVAIRITDINDWPVWTRRYVGDYGFDSRDWLLMLAKSKATGMAIQWRAEWRDIKPDGQTRNWRIPTFKDGLAILSDFRKEADVLDYMFLIHLYASDDRKYPWFDISKEEDIAQLTQSCSYIAEQGIDHIVICTDDWTPNENGRYVSPTQSERDRFGDSCGKAQGYLMARLYKALKPRFPNIELSITPPVYSLLDHKAMEIPGNKKFLADMAAELPAEVSVFWTGPRVITFKVSRQEFLDFYKLVNYHSLGLWDNTECCMYPMHIPYWRYDFYDDYAADMKGLVFLNTHSPGWPWCVPYAVNECDYLWNPKNFQPLPAYRATLGKLYDSNVADIAFQFVKKQQDFLDAANDDQKRIAVKDMEALLPAMDKAGLSTQHPRGALAAVKIQLFTPAVNEMNVPMLSSKPVVDGDLSDACWASAGRFALTANDDSNRPVQKAQCRIGCTKDALYLAFDFNIIAPLEPRNFRVKHDDEIFVSPDVIEIMLQPDPRGDYAHLAFDFGGFTYDEKSGNGAASYDPNWTLRIHRDDKHWTAEVEVPLESLREIMADKIVPAIGKGVVWRANVYRSYKPDPAAASWSSTHGLSYHTPICFGKLRFE